MSDNSQLDRMALEYEATKEATGDMKQAMQAALATIKPPSAPVASEHVRRLVGHLAQWVLCMSHNESYFGEAAGHLKSTVEELARSVDPIYPPKPSPSDSLAGVEIHTATVPFMPAQLPTTTAPPSVPVGVIDAIRHLSKWLDLNDCECESGHQCGRIEVEQTRDQLRTLAQQPAADFDAWQQNPYTTVLMKSIAEDYVPKHDQQPAAVDGAMVERMAQAVATELYGEPPPPGSNSLTRAMMLPGIKAGLTAALAQQPASDGGFTASDMMDARQEGREEAQQPAAVDGARFRKAPCYLCGYNGAGYFQPETHPCAALYHATQPGGSDNQQEGA